MPVEDVVNVLFSPFFFQNLVNCSTSKLLGKKKIFSKSCPPPSVSCKASAGQPKGPRKQLAGSLAPALHLSALWSLPASGNPPVAQE